MTMPVAERMTAAKFLALPVPERGRPWNLVDGEVVVNEPTRLHAGALGALHLALGSWTEGEEAARGEASLAVDVELDGRNVFAPDLLWWAEGRVPPRDARPPYPMPDIAVEVRSPATWRYDIGEKKAGYERHGLPELWLLDTVADRVRVLRRSHPGGPRFDVEFDLGSEKTLTSPLLPGFELPLAGVFPERR